MLEFDVTFEYWTDDNPPQATRRRVGATCPEEAVGIVLREVQAQHPDQVLYWNAVPILVQ